MAIDYDGMGGSGQDENRNEEIPNEIPDNRKTKF